MTKNNGITICGFYGNFNLGDEAMLAGMINLFRDYDQSTRINVISNNPKDTQNRFQVSSIHSQSRKVWPTILSNQYFVLGGGDLLRDSIKNSVAFKWLAYMQKAIMLKRRTMLLGVSVGEIWRQETKQLISQVLNQVDLVAVRDEASKSRLEELGVKNKIYVTSDLALQGLPRSNTFNQNNRNAQLEIGISVRHLYNRGATLEGFDYEKLQKEVAKVIDFLIEKYDARVHLIPFRTNENSFHPTDDDYVTSLEILRYSCKSGKCIVHRYFSSLEDLHSTISNLDLMIGMRLHSLILSAGLGVPIIAAEYDPKVQGFMEEINQSGLSIPLNSFNLDTLSPIVHESLNNLPEKSRIIENSMSNYYKKIDSLKAELSEFFN